MLDRRCNDACNSWGPIVFFYRQGWRMAPMLLDVVAQGYALIRLVQLANEHVHEQIKFAYDRK